MLKEEDGASGRGVEEAEGGGRRVRSWRQRTSGRVAGGGGDGDGDVARRRRTAAFCGGGRRGQEAEGRRAGWAGRVEPRKVERPGK